MATKNVDGVNQISAVCLEVDVLGGSGIEVKTALSRLMEQSNCVIVERSAVSHGLGRHPQNRIGGNCRVDFQASCPGNLLD